ncbi:MAG: metallophosphoesterase [Anaerovoracaceae bacterium]
MKRKPLFLAALAIIAMIILATCGSNSFEYSLETVSSIGPDEGFSFYVVSDPHYLSDTLHDDKEAFQRFMSYGDRAVQYTGVMLEVLLEDIRKNRPDFIVLAGDLTCNGEMESHEELAELLSRVEDMGTQAYVVPGNHDILNPMARHFFENTIWEADYITRDTFAKIYSDFGYDEAVSRDPNSLSYLAKPSEDLWFLMLDTAIYQDNIKDNYPNQNGELSLKTIEWIKNCALLAQENNAKLIAVMHHSLINHSDIINEGYTIANHQEVQEFFFENGIDIAFTGHIHIQDIKSLTKDQKTIYDIATSSLAVYPNQYGIVKYTPGKGLDYSTKVLEIEEYAHSNLMTDENLLHFQDYSQRIFIEQCCRKHRVGLENAQGLTREEFRKVNQLVQQMNLMYFAGYRNEELGHLLQSEGYEILQRISPLPVTDYISAMLNDERADNNKLFIPIEMD